MQDLQIKEVMIKMPMDTVFYKELNFRKQLIIAYEPLNDQFFVLVKKLRSGQLDLYSWLEIDKLNVNYTDHNQIENAIAEMSMACTIFAVDFQKNVSTSDLLVDIQSRIRKSLK